MRNKFYLHSVLPAACLLYTASCADHALEADGDTLPEISGVVVDGYIQGATVFLDLNKNTRRDTGEPSATTDSRGGFSMDVSGFSIDAVKAAFLQAEIPDTAKDSDDLGKTLREAGKQGFTLLSPASAFVTDTAVQNGEVSNAVVSPLSTLVAGEMLASGLSVTDAQQQVRTQLGLGDRSLLGDFVANPDPVLHTVATVTATKLGDAARPSGSSSTSLTDVLQTVREEVPQTVSSLRDIGQLPPADAPSGTSDAGKTDAAVAADAGTGVGDDSPTKDPNERPDGGTTSPSSDSDAGAGAADGGTKSDPYYPDGGTTPPRDADAGAGTADSGTKSDPYYPDGSTTPPRDADAGAYDSDGGTKSEPYYPDGGTTSPSPDASVDAGAPERPKYDDAGSAVNDGGTAQGDYYSDDLLEL